MGIRRPTAVIFTMILGLGVLAGCGEDEDTESAGGNGDAAGECDYPESAQGADGVETPPADPAYAGQVDASIETTAGDFALRLDADGAPCTVNSFVSLADQGFYDDTDCHRLTTEGIFVLQCGDPDGTGMGGPGYTIPAEFDGTEAYPAGTLAMARAQDPDSGGSQFFLVYENTALPPEYTVFGEMDAAGIAVVRDIAEAGIDGTGGDGPPAQPVSVTGITVN